MLFPPLCDAKWWAPVISGGSSLTWMCSSLPSQEPPQSSRVLLKGRISPLWYSVLDTPITLVSPEFRLHFLNKGDTNPCPVARKVSPGRKMGARSRWGIPLVTKVMRKEARHTQRQDWASGVRPDILEHLPPKNPESAYFIALCSHLWHYWGLSPTTISLSLSKS